MTYSHREIAEILAEFSIRQPISMRKFTKQKGISIFAFKRWLDGDLPSNGPRRLNKPLNVHMEDELAAWIRLERKRGNSVSRKNIKERAVKEARERGHGKEKFNAPDGWLTRFLHRYHFSLRTGTKKGRKLVFTEEDMVRSKKVSKPQQLINATCRNKRRCSLKNWMTSNIIHRSWFSIWTRQVTVLSV